MGTGSASQSSWMLYEMSLSEELTLESAIREVANHPDVEKLRTLCAALMRQNYHQQRLLSKAIGRVGELEMVIFLGATAEAHEVDTFVEMAREVCASMGIV